MSKALAGFDRALFAVLGLVLIALGLWPILIHLNVGFATYLASWIDHDAWAEAPAQRWWVWVLCALAIICTGGGIWLIFANTKVLRILKVPSAATNDEGAITIQLNAIADGIAKSLATREFIESAEATVAYDRGHPQLTLTITASAETPLTTICKLVAETETDYRAAFPDSEIETVYKTHYAKLRATT